MAERGEPVLSLVSRIFLNDREGIIERLASGPYVLLVEWMLQQVEQFKTDEDSAMEQLLSKTYEELQEELLTKILERVPPQRRVQGLPPEDRVRGLSPEQLLAGLSKEDAARLRELMDQK